MKIFTKKKLHNKSEAAAYLIVCKLMDWKSDLVESEPEAMGVEYEFAKIIEEIFGN